MMSVNVNMDMQKLPKNGHMFYQLMSTTFHLRGVSKLAQSMVDTERKFIKKFEPQVFL